MSREFPNHPLPGVLALVEREGRLLMVQRGREPDLGKWGFPGGLIELGETVTAAALRELNEETGITAEALGVMDVFDVITPSEDGRIRYHFVLNVVRCRWISGEAKAASDAAATGWYSLTEIDEPALVCSSNVGRLARMALASPLPV
ncbi:ADP-ribose pyrophosphatase [Candidatus Terasakiella magnetica]|nr:ADP-ribose pyrophosphatase [Candidatus Terasakiella magnetica]